jgi:predicted TIM-barrel enzyme
MWLDSIVYSIVTAFDERFDRSIDATYLGWSEEINDTRMEHDKGLAALKRQAVGLSHTTKTAERERRGKNGHSLI